MSADETRAESTDSGTPTDGPSPAYVPPAAEDIDTTHGPAEVVAGTTGSIPTGAEDGARWH
ncbi:MAG TPA: hypothetical protein VII87_08355 [Solirubrobacteraceae bacterium]